VTQAELPSSEKFSNFLCSKCDKDLSRAHEYRLKLNEAQRKLHEEFKDVRPEILVPQNVQVKQEKEEDIPVTMDFMDDDCDYGGQDNYSDYSDHEFVPKTEPSDTIPIQKSVTESPEKKKRTKKRKLAPDDPKASIDVEQKMFKDDSGRTYYVCNYCGEF
jgi:hypothetical protein